MDIPFRGLLGPFLEDMQHVDRLFKLGNVENPKGPTFFSDADLLDTGTDRGHRLPIIRLFPLLYLEELMSRCFPSIFRKLPQIVT